MRGRQVPAIYLLLLFKVLYCGTFFRSVVLDTWLSANQFAMPRKNSNLAPKWSLTFVGVLLLSFRFHITGLD